MGFWKIGKTRNIRPECDGIKKMLEEMQKISPKLKDLVDSEGNLEEIKKTKEALRSIIHKHGMLRYSLKEWERRSKIIQRIDGVEKKLSEEGSDTDLSIDELHTLYKQNIGGFDSPSPFDFSRSGYGKTEELSKKRQDVAKQKEDYARIYGCRPEQVTSELHDIFEENSDIVVFIGDLGFTKKELPQTLKHVSGSLKSGSENATLPKNLEFVGGHLALSRLTSAEGLKLPEIVGGHLDLRSLTSADGLKLPETVGGHLGLRSLESAKELVLPKTIGGYLDLRSLTSARGLVLPETIGGGLDLGSLKSSDGLDLQNVTIAKDLNLPSLNSSKGLVLPKTIGGQITLVGITKSERNELRKQRPDLTIIPHD